MGNSITLERRILEYKQLYPELTRAEILQLIKQDNDIKADVDLNFEKYDKERVQPVRRVKADVVFEIARPRRVVRKAIDHLGNEFAGGRKEMCAYWGITPVLFHSRDMKGWELERILTQPVRPRRTTLQKIDDEIKKVERKEKKNNV